MNLNEELTNDDLLAIIESLNYTCELMRNTEEETNYNRIKCIIWKSWKERIKENL